MERYRGSFLTIEKPPSSKVKSFNAELAAAGVSGKGIKRGPPKDDKGAPPKDGKGGPPKNRKEASFSKQGASSSPESESPSVSSPPFSRVAAPTKEAAKGDSKGEISEPKGPEVFCSLCQNEAEDLLLMQCPHLLCLPCGCRQMHFQLSSDPLALPNVLCCPICQRATSLSEQTAATLIRVIPKEVQLRDGRSLSQAAGARAAAEGTAAAAEETAVAAEETARQEQRQQPQQLRRGVSLSAQSVAAAQAAKGRLHPRQLLAPPYADAPHLEWPFLCSLCEKLSASVYCRNCVRAFCRDCAVQAHAPEDASTETLSALSLHCFSLLERRGVSRDLPLSNASRAKLKRLQVYKTLEDSDVFLSLAECLSNFRTHEKRGPEETADVPKDPREIARSAVSFFHQGHGSGASFPCEDHPNEALKFYCVSCEGKCICAECAIFGEHRRHQLATAKQAWKDILARIEGDLQVILERAEGDTEGARAVLSDRRTEWATALQEHKELLFLTTQKLKKRLAEKQENILKCISTLLKDFVAECKGFRSLMQKKVEAIEAKAQQVAEGKGSLDPHLVLEFVASKHEEFQQFIEADIPQHFLHLPASRGAVLDHLNQLIQDLLGELSALRNKITTST